MTFPQTKPSHSSNFRTRLPHDEADHLQVIAKRDEGDVIIGVVSRSDDAYRLTYCPECEQEQPKSGGCTGVCSTDWCEADYSDVLQSFVTVGCDEA